jgi:hypothetical protein
VVSIAAFQSSHIHEKPYELGHYHCYLKTLVTKKKKKYW